ncbi:helix-turn-helix transcriptional regulator [Paenibacillus cremeus]|uniref:AraC family transcriptional regulator n=1 Tax=Paenibacillus cremeus TaxID=2163881 RepID=A0A559KHY6_9BACL|nr:AraC family transcriptional regulator [Paenibacillus cremeus]TVY11743.1 AraC family transcriptional regulator [Paenibacillus cremeus]
MNLNIFKEPIHYPNPLLHLKVWEFTANGKPARHHPASMKWHYHKEVEFIYVRSGIHSVHTLNHNYILHPGDIFVIGASQLHSPSKFSEEDLTYIVLHVDLQPYFDPLMMMYYPHFSEVRHPLEAFNAMFQEDERLRAEVAGCILRIHEEMMEQRKGYEIAASILIRQIFLAMLRGDALELLKAGDSEGAMLLQPVLEHVERHLSEKIEMEEVSELANMSYSYFSKFFKKTIGFTFTEYVNRQRIIRAEQLLLTTTQTITDIAEAIGIENMAHFYELFKRYNGCTPKQFLLKMKG